ncbi:MAG: cobalamin-dependent protein [Chloroflexota bacterium]
MGDETERVAGLIREQSDELAERIVERQYARQPALWRPFGEEGREKSVRDVGYHLSYLAEALAASDPSLFAEYVTWVRVLFEGLDFPDDVLPVTLTCTREVLEDSLTEEGYAAASEVLDAGMLALAKEGGAPPSYVESGAPLGRLAGRYLEALLEGDRNAAREMILEAVDEGRPVRDIYLHVFQPVQREIGRLWQINQIGVAEEHYCTAATQLIMSQLYPHIFATERTGHRLVATCVGGELHEIGVRMVADFFELEGWDTYYLGANTPTKSVVSTVDERRPQVLGVSATIATNVSGVRSLIERVRGFGLSHEPKILVGGAPFNSSPELWRRVGADGYAADAEEATIVAKRWVSEE